MRNNEWRLVYSGTDLTFGTGASDVFNVTAPDLGDVALRLDDADAPRGDGTLMGTDFRGSRTITFDLGVQGPDEATIRDTMGALATAWRGDYVRSRPGLMAELRMRYRDSERLVYGRPRRYAPSIKEVGTGLLGTATADFTCVNDVFYALTETVATIELVPNAGGGMVAPFAFPLTTSSSSDRSQVIDVGGDTSTWPIIDITGPITNPVIEALGLWRMEFALSLAYDETLTIDTRPWVRTIKVNGASVAGAITRTSSRLAKAATPPGSYEVALRGISSTGTPVARVRVRDAYSSL